MTVTIEQPGNATGVAVSVEGLSKRYRRHWPRGGDQDALLDCGFSLPTGKVAALIGANGAGKTTLLATLAGLQEADAGSVHLAGRTAFVSQDKAVYRHLNAADMLRLGARLNRVWHERKALDWLGRFDVPTDRRCGRLSGGQRAQVALAIAIAACPDVLLLDEPLANLDPLVRREVMAGLLAEAATTGMTVLLSTHIVTELGGVADHLLLLAHGRLVLDGDMDGLLGQHVRYLGPSTADPPGHGEVVEGRHSGGQSAFLVRLAEDAERSDAPEPWATRPVSLEDLVLGYLAANRKEQGA